MKRKMMKALICDAEFAPRPDYVFTEYEKTHKKAKSANGVYKNPKITLKEVAIPKVGARDVLIQVKACGICGTDIHFRESDEDGYMLYPAWTKFPNIIGHEFAGIIVEKGDEVRDFEIGDWVASEQMLWCGECDRCKAGVPCACRHMEELGNTYPGAIAEYTLVKSQYCWDVSGLKKAYIDEDQLWAAAATIEPTGVSYKGIYGNAGGFDPGAHVVVYGGGPIGLGAITLARAGGAATVTCFEVLKERQELAKKAGADYVFNPKEVDISQKVKEVTGGAGADFQVEAEGIPHVLIDDMVKSIAVGSKIVLVGMGPYFPKVDYTELQLKSVNLFTSIGHDSKNTFRNVIRLMANNRIDTTKYITGDYSIDQAVEALEKAAERNGGKVIIRPDR